MLAKTTLGVIPSVSTAQSGNPTCCKRAVLQSKPFHRLYARPREPFPRIRLPSNNNSARPSRPSFQSLSASTETMQMPHAWAPESLSGMLERIKECNVLDGTNYIPLHVDEQEVGYIRPPFAEKLCNFPDVFTKRVLFSGPREGKQIVQMSPRLVSAEARTAAVGEIMQQFREEGIITGWRDELFPVMAAFGDEPVFLVERAAASRFGIMAYGVHVNGYVELPDGRQEMWIARRSAQKPTWPGLLDHIVAGGQPDGMSPAENVQKECGEEAGIPPALASQAVATGVVSYQYSDGEAGLRRDVLFCYDIKLPPDFVPSPQDGEVEAFMRMPVAEVAEIIRTSQDFKPNCNLVIIDFLVRHGYITPEQPKYLQIVEGLRHSLTKL